MHFAAVDRLAVHDDGVLAGDRGDHAVDDVLDSHADLDVRDSLDNRVVEGNQDILVGLDNPVDVAVDTLVVVLDIPVADPDDQVSIVGFVDLEVDIQDTLHPATLAAVVRVAGDSADDMSHVAVPGNRQATLDTTCLHPADSNYHSFISTYFTHNETDRYVANQCLNTPNGTCVDSTETLLRIVDRQMSDRTRIHCVVKSIHT